MGWSTGKIRKRYVDCPTGESKTFLIHNPQHSSDECKVLGDFGAKCDKGKHTTEHRIHPTSGEKINRNKENNAIVNNMVHEILLNKTQKVSAAREALVFWNLIMMTMIYIKLKGKVLNRLKKNLNYVSVRFNAYRKFYIGLKIRIIWHVYMTKK